MLLVSHPRMFTPCMTPCFHDILGSIYSTKIDMGGWVTFLCINLDLGYWDHKKGRFPIGCLRWNNL